MEALAAIVIRRATLADRAGIAAAHTASIRGLAGSHYAPEQIAAWSAGKLPEHYPVADEVMFVAEAGGAVVGFGELRAGLGEVRAVYVAPQAAGRGAGAALLAALEAAARAHGLAQLTLGASLNAETFYLRHGYEATARGKRLMLGGVELPYVAMRKSL